ncbi:MAG: hypothetical protein H6867_08675 [Rhodospirillales bacterium]|nr:hypothetical protein [Rhodospirillales bacterium]MCB9995628.1 hypothetical protein [Rhodospirillales bacterium]
MANKIDPEKLSVMRFYGEQTCEEVRRLAVQANNGSDDDRYGLARKIYDLASIQLMPSLQDIYDDVRIICEDLAERDHVEAIEMLTHLYATGKTNIVLKVSDTDNSRIVSGSMTPDFEKAQAWCQKAVDLGSDWAKAVMSHIEEDIAKAKNKNNPPGPT